MSALPAEVRAFLGAAVPPVDALYRPSWLLDSPQADVWRIPRSPQARQDVDGTADVVQLRWSFKLPEGNLCDPQYACLLLQAKLLMLAVASDGRRAPGTLEGVFRTLLLVVEFAVLTDPDRAKLRGLLSLEIDDVLELVALAAQGGSFAVGRCEERWTQWLNNRIDSGTEEALALWTECQPASVRVALGWGVDGGAPSDLRSQDRRMALSRAFLLREKAYEDDGELSRAYIARAINVSVYRLMHMGDALSPFALRAREVPEQRLVAGRKSRNTTRLCGELVLLGELACQVPALQGWALCETTTLRDRLEGLTHVSGDRTKTIPLSVGLAMIRRCLAWMTEVAPLVERAVAEACRAAATSAGSGACLTVAQRLDAWFERHPLTLCAGTLEVRHFWRFTGDAGPWLDDAGIDPHPPTKSAVPATSVALLIDLHVAITFVLAAVFSCSRRSEILELTDDDLLPRGELWFLRVLLRKSGAYAVRRAMHKPVPPVVAQAMRSLRNMRDALARVLEPAGERSGQQAFFVIKRGGVKAMNYSTFGLRLSLLSRYLAGAAPGEVWALSPHQLRRFFAVTFFHHGGRENALPALTWFMGHTAMAQTWRYIQDSLGGREITAVEAALATAAVLSDSQAANVERLRRLLREHFGQDDLWTIDEEQVEAYLCVLRSQGTYTATPKQIRTVDGMRHTVLIHFEKRRAT